MKNRLERRIWLLRGKREGAWDTDQRWHEDASRARVARRIRALLRRNDPVVLITPRWSQPARFLDDLALDLQVAAPRIRARALSLQPLQARSVVETWQWLVRAIGEFAPRAALTSRASQCVDRHGFRSVISQMLARTVDGPRMALMMHAIEHLHLEVREDLWEAFSDHVESAGAKRTFNLLLAGALEPNAFDIENTDRVTLPDFGRREAAEAIVEHTGPMARDKLDNVWQLVGGVPALIEQIGRASEVQGLAADRDGLWRALGPLAEEVRGALAIVSAVDGLGERLEEILKTGEAEERAQDRMLLRAGLLTQRGTNPRRVRLRAPVFADLATAR